MKKLYIQNEAPVKEETVIAKDKGSTIVVGFVFPKKDELKTIHKGFLDALKVVNTEEAPEASDTAIQAFLEKQIRYIKGAALQVYDDQTEELLETISIADTRKPQELEFWTSPKECREVVLFNLFNSISWRGQIFDAYNEFLLELVTGKRTVIEEEIKN